MRRILPFAILLMFFGCREEESIQDARPNIILIMADDMGFSDIGSYGGEVKTSNIDRLAENGLRFTQFYNGARCCPTRASLLTGLYPHQTGIGYMVSSNPQPPGYLGDLNSECITIAEALGTSGYRTYMSGKWHLTPSLSGEHISNWPMQRGFEKFYGTITGAGSYFDPATLTYGNEPIQAPDPYYYTDAISDSAVSFINHHLESEEDPFFLYVAYTAPHWPLHAQEESIAEYEGLYSSGWDQLREARLKKLKELGILPKNMEMSPLDPRIAPWDSVENKALELRKMEVYASQITSMDRGIGRIMASLEKQEKLENTLILFLADNGGCAEEFYEETAWVRNYGPEFTRSDREVIFGNDTGLPAGPPETYQSYGLNWANLSNTPFRYYKHYAHEGGISTPFIVHWPKQISQNGGLRNTPAHIIDIMPTLLEVAGAKYPQRVDAHSITPVEGLSLVGTWARDSLENRSLFWEHGDNRAVRRGPWKLVGISGGSWELYNIVEDRAELHNLIAEKPGLAKELAAEWETWARRTHVIPKPN